MSTPSLAILPPAAEEYESAGKLPPFTEFGSDVEAPGVLERVASQISYKREIVLVCGDGSAYASPTALNTVLQLYALRIRHVLYMSDGPAACARLRRAVPSLACAWSSIINTSKPKHDSVLVKKWWDMRFYFYNVRKHMLSRLAGDLGYNVLQTDTDVAYFANPFPALKAGAIGRHQLVIQPDLPLANAGVMYAQRMRPTDAAAWVLRELITRIRAFSFHPELVPRLLPWARPPYFSNADEQSLLNDCLASAIAETVRAARPHAWLHAAPAPRPRSARRSAVLSSGRTPAAFGAAAAAVQLAQSIPHQTHTFTCLLPRSRPVSVCLTAMLPLLDGDHGVQIRRHAQGQPHMAVGAHAGSSAAPKAHVGHSCPQRAAAIRQPAVLPPSRPQGLHAAALVQPQERDHLRLARQFVAARHPAEGRDDRGRRACRRALALEQRGRHRRCCLDRAGCCGHVLRRRGRRLSSVALVSLRESAQLADAALHAL